MTKSKKHYGRLRFVDFSKYDKYTKQVERKGEAGWRAIAWIDCRNEKVNGLNYNKYSVEDLEEIIMYIKLNREIWRRFTYPSANVLGLSVKKGMPVADTRRLPVEGFYNRPSKPLKGRRKQ